MYHWLQGRLLRPCRNRSLRSSFSPPCARRQRRLSEGVLSNAASHPLNGDLDAAACAVRRELEFDRAAEFVRDEIAYEARAVPGLDWRHNWGTAALTPFDHHERPRIRALSMIPINGRSPIRGRERAVFHGVRDELMKHHRHGL